MSEARKTQPIKLDERFHELLEELQIEDTHGTATLTMYDEVLFLIDSMVLRLVVKENQTYTLGRFTDGNQHEVDLNPYGALQKGVSRHHAKLMMTDDKLYIVDLNSTNGTYVSKKRLQPMQPALLHKGHELLLGRMRMQVVFQ